MNELNWKRSTAAGLVIAAGLVMWRGGVAQEAPGRGERRGPDSLSREPADVLIEAPAPPGPPAPQRELLNQYEPGSPYGQRPGRAPSDRMRAIREAAAALGAAEDDHSRVEARERLDSLLNEYFEEDMKRRENELAEVEERVKKLHAQLERRREKKSDIIELQIKVLLNEADGLGFFGNEGPAGPWFGGPGGGASTFYAPQQQSGPPWPSVDGAAQFSPQPVRVPLPPGAAPTPQPRRALQRETSR